MSAAKVNRNFKVDINKALAKMCFGCNLPFSFVDSIFFRDFVKLLNPNYIPPTSKTLKTTMLDETYEQLHLQNYMKERVKGTLMIDGWKNSSNNSKQVAVMVKPKDGKEIFVKSYDYSMKSENHQELLATIEDASKVALDNFNIEVDSFISDNAAPVKKTGQESGLIFYTCNAHTGNLFFKDVRDENVYSLVHELMVKFRHSQLETNVSLKFLVFLLI